ncbi:transketolase [Mycobacterium neglectum]|uniref:transketolase n=1 Tax=Mycobacterium neglectum TaxID=242737 RepID=UPI000BFEF1DF|nr:transketolase [Mycobacterium neglectum]
MTRADHADQVRELEAIARRGRWLVISTVARAGAGHVGGPLSAMDLLVGLYFHTLRIDPNNPSNPARDRFILSKGHSAMGLYAVLAMRGYFPEAELSTFDKIESRLQGHPDMRLLPGLDMSTGSLGQGLSVGVGMAMAAHRRGEGRTTWVLLGDGELQEGMVWEAVHTAPRYRLGNLVAIVDHNGLQQFGWDRDDGDRGDRRDPWRGVDLAEVFAGFGWRVLSVDGHDMAAVLAIFGEATRGPADMPTVILANTTKGKGVSFAENTINWHTGLATEDELTLAAAELGIEIAAPEGVAT